MHCDKNITVCYTDTYQNRGNVETYKVMCAELISNNSVLRLCVSDIEKIFIPINQIKWIATNGVDL